MTIHHIVLIKTRSDTSSHIVSEVIAELCDQTPSMEYQQFSASRAKSADYWDIMFDMRFPTIQDIDIFLNSDEHTKISRKLAEHIEKLNSFDVEAVSNLTARS